tara:strand:- start:4302 stop:5081 length:780 start_codon:yes stop_codon:yes gene_type:complete
MKFKPKKKLGQNFLVDEKLNNFISKLGNINREDTVLEIGPGKGNLTKFLINENPKKLILIEKDNYLANELKIKFKGIDVINEDYLDVDEKNLNLNNTIVYGNLPYNVSSQILIKLIKLETIKFKKLILMFQKEMADRILADTNTKSYGRLSIISQWRMNITKIKDILPQSFRPIPKIMSTLLKFEPKQDYYKIKEIKKLEFVTNTFFNYRRKMIKKPLGLLFKDVDKIKKKYNLNINERPQKLNPLIYYKLSNELNELG